jgi:pimeloyl-ACP methyl ester carboxylesterase
MATEIVRIVEKSVALSHGSASYFEGGAGHPVILLHGSGIEQGGADFLPCFETLGRDFRVLAPNLLGWPPTDTLPDIASFPYLVDFIREFQDAMGMKSSHVVGVSMGAWIAAIFAYESPARVDKLVITGNPGLRGSPNDRMLSWQAPDDEAVRKWLSAVTGVPGIDGEALLQEKLSGIRRPGVAEGFAALMKHMGTAANRKRYAMDRRLPSIEAPTLHLWGKTDPHIDQAETWQKLTPNSQLKLVDAGHRLHVENPSLFSQAVADFLKSTQST